MIWNDLISLKWTAFMYVYINMWLFHAHILIHCIDILDVTISYGKSYDFIAFFGYFHVWSVASSPNFHKLYVWLMYTLWNVNIPNMSVGYGRFSYLIAFFEHFHILLHVWTVKTSSTFYKLYVIRNVFPITPDSLLLSIN